MPEPAAPRRRRLIRSLTAGLLKAVAVIAAVAFIFWSTGCMERMFYYPRSGKVTPPAHLEGVEDVFFASADGTSLHGWFIPSATGPAEEAATIIHVHGNAGNLEDHIGYTEFLPPSGFNLFIFDYRGYGQSEGKARKREPLIADAHAALDAMLARPDVDPGRIGLFGQSLGGAIGLNLMADRPEIRAAVIVSTFSSWRDAAAGALGGDPPNFLARWVALVTIPDGHKPIDAIRRIDRPIFLMHGDADRVVRVANSRRLKDAAGEQTRYLELPGGDHVSLRYSHPEIDGLMVEFYRTELSSTADVEQEP